MAFKVVNDCNGLIDHKTRFPLSYKDYMRGTDAAKSHNWIYFCIDKKHSPEMRKIYQCINCKIKGYYVINSSVMIVDDALLIDLCTQDNTRSQEIINSHKWEEISQRDPNGNIYHQCTKCHIIGRYVDDGKGTLTINGLLDFDCSTQGLYSERLLEIDLTEKQIRDNTIWVLKNPFEKYMKGVTYNV